MATKKTKLIEIKEEHVELFRTELLKTFGPQHPNAASLGKEKFAIYAEENPILKGAIMAIEQSFGQGYIAGQQSKVNLKKPAPKKAASKKKVTKPSKK